eukprot:m.345276 g.345276  ORF g.345276 m.345276 type:complete len:535 (-) comp27895_c0_seq4:22-1626(-)
MNSFTDERSGTACHREDERSPLLPGAAAVHHTTSATGPGVSDCGAGAGTTTSTAPQPALDRDGHHVGTAGPNEGHPPHRSGLQSVLVFSLAFFLAFTAWHPLQNLESTIFHGGSSLSAISGTVALGITYGTNVFAAGTIAPIVVRRLGVKSCLLFQFTAFCLVVLANVYPRVWTVYPASVIAGAGSALLWVAEGHFITEVALADSPSVSRTGAPVRGVLGMYSGIFMGAFALTQVAGNALSSAVLLGCRNGPVSANYIMFALFGSLLVAAIVVTAVGVKSPRPRSSWSAVHKSGAEEVPADDERDTAHSSHHAQQIGADADESWSKAIVRQIGEGASTAMELDFIFLAPMIFANGMDGAFIFGDFTGQFLEPRVGENRIGLNMSTFGATNAIAALIVGRLSDRIGRLIPLTFGTIVYCGTLTLIALVPDQLNTYAASAAVGVGNGIIFTLTYSLLSDRFAEKSATAYGLKSIVENIASAGYFFMSQAVPLRTKLWLGVGLNMFGLLALYIPTRPKDSANRQVAHEAATKSINSH